MRKQNYAKLFTLRKDGVYQKYVNGKYLYSKDPEELYRKWQEYLLGPKEKTVREVGEEWSAKHKEEVETRTWNNYRPHFENIIAKYGDKKISELSAQNIITDLMEAKSKGYSQTIVKTIKAIYSSMLDFAVINGYIKFNPCHSVKTPKGLPKSKRYAPTDAEVKKIIESKNSANGFFAFFLLCTGLRKSEALALTKEDINLETREITITKSLDYANGGNPVTKSTKTESSNRVIPIINILFEPLQVWMKRCDNIIFPSPKSNRNPGGGYMTDKAYEVMWTKYCQETGLNITAHQIRHGTATIMFESGVDVYTAKEILGHSNINTTMSIYTELRAKQRAKSIELFENYQ